MTTRQDVAAVAAFAACAFVALADRASASADARPRVCGGLAEAHVLVRTDERLLYLCDRGQSETSIKVRLARGGLGKRQAGDKKLPVGEYGLGSLRKSSRYGLFVPIEYPTREQRKQGYTGGGIGIHGPDRRVRFLGSLTNMFDTTEGCVGIATDDEMARIADWIRTHRPKRILITPGG
jgi:murein L,D-transpeptidase YafK